VTAEGKETRLTTQIEALRRREYELITSLLEVVPRIDNLDDERVTQLRDALFHADHPFLLVFLGPFSSGKSTLINALLGESELLRVGPIPTTDKISILRWGESLQRMEAAGGVDTVFHPSPLLKKVSFVDTPGLESVFQEHEATTRKFLHRSDVVLLVMLATQAMTARNVEYIQMLREFGKKVIILINQADLLNPEETTSVRDYVMEQSESRLGFKPDVWLVSGRKGLAAQEGDTRDESLWRESGLNKLEDYIDTQLDDVERMRQKLQTPLQIAQNVTRTALEAVQANQVVLDDYQSIADNVRQQLAGYRREQEQIVRATVDEIQGKFGETTMRGSEAIGDIFQLSRALGSVWRGFTEMIGLARLFRRKSSHSYTRLAFERHKVYEPLRELPGIVAELAPRLEGRDMHDIDDLVSYGQREIKALPPTIRDKVIGNVQAPVKYDRTALTEVTPELEAIEREAVQVEADQLEGGLRNVLYGVVLWELLVIIALAGLVLSGALDFSQLGSFIILFLLMGGGILGLLIMPLAGRFIESGHTNRLLKIQARYIESLTRAADQQVDYGMRLREDVVAPLTRLVESQTQIHNEQLNRLEAARQTIASIEADLSKLGKRSLLGLRG
jgi:GTP-binding protein EngB required for normal cell division